MATTYQVQDHHILQFTSNVELLLQQKQPRLQGTVNAASYKGKMAQVVKQFGEVEFSPLNAGTDPGQWKGDTVWSDIEHFQRWVIPTDNALSLADAEEDDVRMLGDPKSAYAEAARAAYARLYDDYVISALTNPAKAGTYDDLQDIALPAENIIGHDYDPDTEGQGLTVAKLIKARELLLAAHNDPGEARYFACSEAQISDLLHSDKIGNADYNNVKALVRGEVDTFMGFKFVTTERLLSTAGTPNLRHCAAWVKSAVTVGTWNALSTRVSERADKNYVWQIYLKCTLGATRTQEKKVIQVNCAEAA